MIVERRNISFLVNVYGLNGEGVKAVELFEEISQSQRDSWMFVCVLNACSHSKLIDQAEKIFSDIQIEQRSEQIYTIMVNCFQLDFGREKKKKKFFRFRLTFILEHFSLIELKIY